MAYEYGPYVTGMALGDARLFPGDASSSDRPWKPPRPEAAATLWRYMSFAKFYSLLESQGLFFALVSEMEDNYEGFICPPPPRAPGDRLQQAEQMGHEVLRKIARTPLVNCWTEADHESSLMWNAYAKSEGVAIRTTFGDLLESILSTNPGLPIPLGRVVYVEDPQQKSPRFGPAPYFHKRVEYRAEEEVRAVLPGPPWASRLEPGKPNTPIVDVALDSDVADRRGRYITVDLNTLIKEVVVPGDNGWFDELVQSVVDRADIKASVVPSTLESSPDDAPRRGFA